MRSGAGLSGVFTVALDSASGFQRDAGVFAAHRAAVDEPAAIWLVLGYSMHGPPDSKYAVRRRPSLDGLIMVPEDRAAGREAPRTALRSETNGRGGRAR
jgi:hypothetical protein